MSLHEYSRYTFCIATKDVDGKLFLSPRIPFGFRVFSDTTIHTATQGDSLWALAARAYAGIPRPAGLWWIIADFQPEPILDPTVQLAVGTKLFIPSLRIVQERIFSETRRTEDDI